MGKIKNLSLRKTIVLYMIISLIISFYLSALIMRIASTVQNNIWWNYVDQEEYFEMAEGDGRRYLPDVPRPHSYEMKEFDYHVSEICDFLQTFTVLIVSVAALSHVPLPPRTDTSPLRGLPSTVLSGNSFCRNVLPSPG